ncbi:Uncharacterised protein [Streptococcus acidominimus]|uniref:Uncharacterized protein n=1 Tax=Streptococcus acidominimus TaxID=1326 RepID=A0A380IFH4_STRAI|nr:Uncharacterised protein [Streptococcus acidominimus]
MKKTKFSSTQSGNRLLEVGNRTSETRVEQSRDRLLEAGNEETEVFVKSRSQLPS